MKTIEEIKNEIAVKHGYKDYNHAYMNMRSIAISEFIDEVAEQYAKQRCDEQIDKCFEFSGNQPFIRNTPNVVTTK